MKQNRFFVLFFFLSVGCASSRMGNTKIDSAFRAGHYDEASELLKKGLEDVTEEGRDGLLYLLDLGMSEHLSGKYVESEKAFLRADKLAEIKDYTSLSSEAGTLFTTDNIKQYKGEEFENVLINVYLALDYALEGKFDDALVECRRVNRKLYLMISEGKRKYELNAFAAYLSGVLFESKGEWNEAYVSYKQTHDILPSFDAVGADLIRMAAKLRMTDEVEKWEEEFSLSSLSLTKTLAKNTKNLGQIVVVFQNGIAPKKVPSAAFYSVPEFRTQFNPVSHAIVTVKSLKEGASIETATKSTAILQNVEADAIKSLKEKWAGIIAKKIAGIAAKEVLGNAIDSKTGNNGIGQLVKLALYVSDQADIRSWSTLPKDLQIARFFVEPGSYEVDITPAERTNSKTERVVQVQAGKTVFTTVRFQP